MGLQLSRCAEGVTHLSPSPKRTWPLLQAHSAPLPSRLEPGHGVPEVAFYCAALPEESKLLDQLRLGLRGDTSRAQQSR